MTVYVDVLLTLNFAVDYFVLLVAQKLSHSRAKTARSLCGAFFGSLFSLYIFVPDSNFTFDLLVCVTAVALMTFITQGACGKKRFLKICLTTLLVNQLYSGAMALIYNILSPPGIAVCNGIVYYQISPLLILLFTVVFYLLISCFVYFFKSKGCTDKNAVLTVLYKNSSVCFNGIIDTGNSAVDPFTSMPVIFVNKQKLIAEINGIEQNKFRIIPYNDISGRGHLFGFTADTVNITVDGKIYIIEKPVIGLYDGNLKAGDASAIINPQIFEYAKEKTYI